MAIDDGDGCSRRWVWRQWDQRRQRDKEGYRLKMCVEEEYMLKMCVVLFEGK